MKARYLVVVLVLSLAVVLSAGCGSKAKKATNNTPAGNTAVTTASTPTKGGAEESKPAGNAVKTAINSPATSYSADMVSATPAGQNITSKMYMDNEIKSRIEMMGQVIIVRRDKGKMWMVNDAAKTVMEMPIDEKMLKDMDKAKVDRAKLKPVGEESIDGYDCEKYIVTNEGTTANVWIAKKHGLPVKIEGGGATINFKNIKVGKQPASLFEIPAGYKTQQMPDMSQMQNAPNNTSMPMPSAPK